MSKLVVIIGAGFSRPVGLPLGNDIKERFDRDQREKLLNFSSGEWMWEDGKSKTDLHNGKIHNDWLTYSYVLNELIQSYKEEKGTFENYELFYQFIIDNKSDKQLFENIYGKAKTKILEDYPSVGEFEPQYDGDVSPYLYRLSNDTGLKNIVDIINYLIGDLLGFSEAQFSNAIGEYEQFIEFINQYKEVEIFTLNHDLLLERLLDAFGIDYTRGFTIEESEIHYESEPLPVFRNNFDAPVRINKLHGSLDFFRFEHYEEQGKPYLQPTGKYNYFTTMEYRAKHNAVRINPTSGEVAQDMNFDVVPKFITGTDKSEIIRNDIMYAQLFSRFEEVVSHANKILITGYSYRDVHINQELQKRSDLNIINQNPSSEYPFEANTLSHINSLMNLNQLLSK
ncbi:MAG: hypothetical protein WBB27_09245 [Maribacter sp.]